jgi:type II secretory pathway component GspD/PulD (secretin)
VNQIMRSPLATTAWKLSLQLVLAGCVTAAASIAVAQPKGGSAEPAAAGLGTGETTPRPQAPPGNPDPKELELQPDDEGRVRFNFQGQPWLGILEWIAKVSHLSLDWQELPAGFLNLRTQQTYTIEEARDLINRHLLDRGFTLLKHGEILSVVNIKKLDPSLVPRLEPEELAEARPHDFVRVSFALEWMTAETAVEELKSLISPNGKLTALKSANRLEAIDAVANLREIGKLLGDEQGPRGPKRLVREFKLQHVKAAEVQPQLHKLLGLDKSAQANADPAALVQQMAKIMKESGVLPGQGLANKPQGPQVFLVANVRDNSILAHAPADQMAIITEAIKVIDNPSDRARSVLRNNNRVQVYPLAVSEPEALLKMLQELADLSPETRLQIDRKKRAIIAHANLADHLTIRTLIDKLDGTVRNFRVIPLNRLEADYVAGSIDMVMGGGDSKKVQTSRAAEDESRRFRVVADVEKNRLLLWVNDQELEDVKGLLAELGENANAGEPAPATTTVRVLDALGAEQAREILRRLKEVWPGVAPNPLELGPGVTAEEPQPPKAEAPLPPAAPGKSRPPATAANATSTAAAEQNELKTQAPPGQPVRLVRLATLDEAASDPTAGSRAAAVPNPIATPEPTDPAAKPASPPAVRIERDASGRLIVVSEDAAAVELLQKILAEISPAAKDFHVFRMKHKSSWAYGISENLKLYFDERQKLEERQKSPRESARWYDPSLGRWINSPRADESRRQPVRKQPRFIVDADTNSILAVGADAEQVKAIGELIDLYDKPEARDPHAPRITRLVKVKHGQVKQIAETVKEVYRDLLSANDAAQQSAQRTQRPIDTIYTFAFNSAKPGREKLETLVRYKGQLSIGIDESSKSLVVSAPEPVLESVEATIASLDDAALAAKPRVQVMKIDRSVDTGELQRRIMRAMGKSSQ